MDNKKKIIIISIILVVLLTIVGTYAYWMWFSDNNKTILFNTSQELSEYIIYDEGESKFIGDLEVSSSYLYGANTTISIYKTEAASNTDLYATINMNIKEIGENISNSSAVKWTLTKGNSTNPGEILSNGNFYQSKVNDTLELLPNIEITTEKQEYTIWIWVDSSESPSGELIQETLDTLIWTQVDQVISE